ncbi:hypothetical protein [Thermoflavimicrobium dichotomicum]|uniref:Cytosolic protein n=1 Tax=Thermoflavimicrobium dichotomicum TaxID=46223 RepID=A0A1I3LSB6_9BACL|nr:hypothetical protein [Thermoflavimicrobium dichotomicum]SFI87632.1 hypothetical protein SAMN05421852_102305 [Thermoflavimicrobium dichotomicum]
MSKQPDFKEFKTVESMRNEILPEEFPEGPYGSSRNEKLGKNSPWEADQYRVSAFTYENREFHEDLQRQIPGSHPLHDDPDQ